LVRELKRFDTMNDNKPKGVLHYVELWGGTVKNPKGAGRKNKYKEKTTTIAFRCPESKKEEINKVIKDKLKEWEV